MEGPFGCMYCGAKFWLKAHRDNHEDICEQNPLKPETQTQT